jgi:hypothetical protein
MVKALHSGIFQVTAIEAGLFLAFPLRPGPGSVGCRTSIPRLDWQIVIGLPTNLLAVLIHPAMSASSLGIADRPGTISAALLKLIHLRRLVYVLEASRNSV